MSRTRHRRKPSALALASEPNLPGRLVSDFIRVRRAARLLEREIEEAFGFGEGVTLDPGQLVPVLADRPRLGAARQLSR